MAESTEQPPASTDNKLQSLELPPKERLKDLIAQATALYAVKDYSPAAELYSQATELQAELDGEMNPDNAELLYNYGKCLYFVAVRSSEVLGVSSAGAKLSVGDSNSHTKPTKKRKLNGDSTNQGDAPSSETGKAKAVDQSQEQPKERVLSQLEQSLKKEKEEPDASKKAYFSITGDENWDPDSDEDGEDAEADATVNGEGSEPEEEEQDDFSLAFEILDVARVLLLRKLDILGESLSQQPVPEERSTNSKTREDPDFIPSIAQAPEIRIVKERLADVHDLQAEISLEGERYTAAVSDLQSSLALKEDIFTNESSMLAECHYKLSLALEFASKTQQRDEDGNPVGEPTIDETMRAESIREMERAIESCERRIKKEQLEVDNLAAGTKRDKAIKDIDEVREIVQEMKVRLDDLSADPVNAVDEANRQSGLDTATGGLLKEILEKSGGSKEDTKRLLEQAAVGARDLSGLVKKKKSASQAASAAGSGFGTPEPASAPASGKRKVAFADELDRGGVESSSKKAKVEDVEDSEL